MKILIIAFPDVFVTTFKGNADQAICMTLHENTVDFPKLKAGFTRLQKLKNPGFSRAVLPFFQGFSRVLGSPE